MHRLATASRVDSGIPAKSSLEICSGFNKIQSEFKLFYLAKSTLGKKRTVSSIYCQMLISFPNLGPKTLKLGLICFTKIPEASSNSSISLTLTSDFIMSDTSIISSL